VAFTRSQFYIGFDVFDLTDYSVDPPVPNAAQDAKVEAAMGMAELQTDRSLFPSTTLSSGSFAGLSQADVCIMYLTAHLLARDPSAMNARLQKSRGDEKLYTGEDVYWPVYERLARAATSGFRGT
jgi:hypothetical protein